MKKLVIALFIAILMVSLCSAAFASGFSDTMGNNPDQQAAIGKLSALKIINGYPDGTFKPDDTITRAEFAKIATELGGMGASADVLKDSPVKFSDVKAGEWYSGFVNLAVSQGWLKGFPDGTFRPNNKISYAEVVTVFLRILGYNDNLPGPWPVDYIAKAGSIDITEDISFDSNNPAARVDVAVMGNETLDATLVKWNVDREDFEDETRDEDGETVDVTLMDDRFKSALVEDVWFGPDLRYDEEKNQFTIDIFNRIDIDGDGSGDGHAEVAPDYTLVGGGYAYSIPYCEMHMADVIYDEDEEEITYIEVISKVIASDDIEIKTQEDGKVTSVTVDGNKRYDVIADVFVTDGDVPDNLKAFYRGVDNDGNEKFDGEFYKICLNEDNEVYIIGDISGPDLSDQGLNNEYTVVDEKGWDPEEGILYTVSGEEEYKLYEDYDDVYVLINTGPGSLEALKPGYALTINEKDNGHFAIIDACTPEAFIPGKYEGVSQDDELPLDDGYDEIIISGKDYDISPWCVISQDNGKTWDDVKNSIFDDMATSDIKFFLNYSGDVAMIITNIDDESNKIYGVVTDFGIRSSSSGDKINEIEVLKADGSEATYNVDTAEVELFAEDDELRVDDFIKFTVDDDNVINGLTILAYWNDPNIEDPYMEGTANVKDDYSDDDNIDYIGMITDGNDDALRIKFNGTWYTLDDSTVVFNGGYASDDDEADVEDNEDLVDLAQQNGPDAPIPAFVQFDGNTVEYIYVNTIEIASAGDADYALIVDTFVKSGDHWVEIDVKGTKEEYEVKGSVPDVDSMYDYSISSNKFSGTEVFDPDGSFTYEDDSVSAGVYMTVQDVDKSGNAVKVNGAWIYADDDTVIYDYSDYYDADDDPEYCANVKSISKGDYIIFYGSEDELDLIVILNYINE